MVDRPLRVLLIEDNPGDARLIREILISPSWERLLVDHSASLRDGIERTRHELYDVILLDLSLPDSFGVDTLLKMRAEAKDVAIVVLTGNDDTELGVQAVQHGAQDFIPKSDIVGKILIRSIRYAVERQRTEATLRRSEEEYRSLINDVFEKSMVGVIILDRELRVVWCNEAIEAMFGIQRDELLGRDKRRLIDDKLKCVFDDPEDYATRLLRSYENDDFSERFECHVTKGAHRSERWLEHWSQPIRTGMYDGGRIEQYTDITEAKRLADQARELVAMHERQRLARDLHDSVSQTMFTCRTLAETALRRFEKDPKSAHEMLKEVVEQTGNALAEMRILLLELRPAALTQIGLKALFEQYLGPIQGRRRFNLHLELENVPSLPPDVQIALYRIAQEALNNIDKHAEAENVEISAIDSAETLTLAISDDGRGFEMNGVSATSMGLGIMRERATQIGAEIEIDSKPGVGTRIRVIWEKG